jgi:hypothetical protein
VTLFAVGTRMGSVTLSAQLEDAYARSVGEAFTSLLPGTTVTLQGKFAAQRTGLDDAAFVDRTTGRRLTAEDFKKLDAREAETVAPKTSAPGRIQLR